MRNLYFLLVAFLLSTTVVACGPSAEPEQAAPTEEAKVSWSYEGEGQPAAWGSLDAAFAACSEGVQQSPINISVAEAMAMDLPNISLMYASGAASIADTGHGFNVVPEGSNTLMIGDDVYTLLQFHAHTPSEHTLDGRSFPMEVHFVHQNEAGQLAVVGVMIEEVAGESVYGPVAGAIADGSMALAALDFRSLLPENLGYFAYAGSLTTPPCSEGVRWNVLATPIGMTAEQIAVFANAHGVTNRPVQPLGDRMVHSEVTTD